MTTTFAVVIPVLTGVRITVEGETLDFAQWKQNVQDLVRQKLSAIGWVEGEDYVLDPRLENWRAQEVGVAEDPT